MATRAAARRQEKSFEERLNALVLGQSEASAKIAPWIKIYRAGLHNTERPAGVFLLLGPTGSGKTRTCEAVSEILHDSDSKLLTINCGEFQTDHEVAKLVGCFVPGTEVVLKDGSRKAIQSIQVGDRVLSNTGELNPVQEVYEYGYAGPVVQLRCAGSPRTVELTPEHEVFALQTTGRRRGSDIFKDENLKYVKACELTEGDYVVYPRPKTEVKAFDNPFNGTINDLARLCGYYISDGGTNYKLKGVNFTFGFTKTDAREDLLNLLSQVFPTTHVRIENRKSSDRIYIHTKETGGWFASNFGSGAGNKYIPEWLMNAPEEVVWDFLDAAFMGDGCRTQPRRISYATVSPKLASQLQFLFARLGVMCQWQTYTPKNEKWSVKNTLIIGSDQISRVVSKMKLFGPKIGLKLTGNIGISRGFFVNDNYIFLRVQKTGIREYAGPVYDLSVKNDPSYVVDFKVHNSPPGYIGHKESIPLLSQSRLVAARSNRSNLSVVLLDEIEKAAPAFQRAFLSVLDKGFIRMGDNSNVTFKDTLIFMTSNLGSRALGQGLRRGGYHLPGLTTPTRVDRSAINAARRHFSTEFFNRIDETIVFNELTQADIYKILDIELSKIGPRSGATRPRFVLEVSGPTREFLVACGYSREYGARELQRVIRRYVVAPLAGVVTTMDNDKKYLVRVNKKGENLQFSKEVIG